MVLSGRDIKWHIEKGLLGIDPIKPEQFQQNGVDLIMADWEQQPGTSLWYLGTTAERVTLPDDLMAFVELRSTWARRGLSIPPTIIDAGFHGDITLEIVQFGTTPPPRGELFAHIIFTKLTGPAEPYRGKYQGQRGITRG